MVFLLWACPLTPDSYNTLTTPVCPAPTLYFMFQTVPQCLLRNPPHPANSQIQVCPDFLSHGSPVPLTGLSHSPWTSRVSSPLSLPLHPWPVLQPGSFLWPIDLYIQPPTRYPDVLQSPHTQHTQLLIQPPLSSLLKPAPPPQLGSFSHWTAPSSLRCSSLKLRVTKAPQSTSIVH